eukprot:COSAG02_NODE_2737_length_8129_cov_8.051308_2_plen_1029_part_00
MADVVEIAAACRTLLDWRSTAAQRAAAEVFVGALRKSQTSWTAASETIRYEPALELGVRMLTAQTLRAQAQRQRQPTGPEMVATALQLLALEATRSDGRPVVTQLCLTAAAAGARALEWPVTEVLGRLTADALPHVVKLELIALLPEELDEKRLSMNPARRQALRESLCASSAEVEGWICGACSAEVGPDFSWHHSPQLGAALRCLKSWIAFDLLGPHLVAASPLLQAAIVAVVGASVPDVVREEAVEVLCAACAMSGRDPLLQVLPHLDTLAASVEADSTPLSVRRCACRSIVAIGVAMAPDLLAWAPSAGGSEGPMLSRLTTTLGSCSTDKEQALAELCQDFWLALADALSSTPGAEANLLLLQWMVGVCASRCVLPMAFLLSPALEDGEEEAEDARVSAADVLKAVADGPPSHALALMLQLDSELAASIERSQMTAGCSDGVEIARLEAVVYTVSMVGRAALSNGCSKAELSPDSSVQVGEALEGLAQCILQLLEKICALVPLFASVPLLHRTCIVAIGTLSLVTGRSSSVLNTAMEIVGASLSLPSATMRAWGRGEDHVGSVAFWRLASNCAVQLWPALPQLAGGTMTAEVRATMESRGWDGRQTDGRQLLVKGLCAVLSAGVLSCDSPDSHGQLARGANSVIGPILLEVQTGTNEVPEVTFIDADVWSHWCGRYTSSLCLLGAAISAAPPHAVCLLWPQIWETVVNAVQLVRTLGSADASFQELADAIVGVLVEVPRCFVAPSFAQAALERDAAASLCDVATAGFTAPSLMNRACWLQPLSATVRCCQEGSSALEALAESFPTAAEVFLEGMRQASRDTDENAAVWSSMYSLILDMALKCPSVLCRDAAQLLSLLDMLVDDLLRADGCAASDRTAGIVGLRIIAKINDWAFAQPGVGDSRIQLSQLVQQWLVARGELATTVGILGAASGALPPWMIDNLADALWGLGEFVGGERLGSVLHTALCSEVLPYPVRRLKPDARTTALGPLLAAKDRRVFKRSLKAICGGKKKGVSGAPPATSTASN